VVGWGREEYIRFNFKAIDKHKAKQIKRSRGLVLVICVWCRRLERGERVYRVNHMSENEIAT
jgi:hypothetical protein